MRNKDALSPRAIQVLRTIAYEPQPCHKVNFGIAAKLMRKGLIKVIIKTHPNSLSGKFRYYKITEQGEAVFVEQGKRA